ncbi:zinc-binding dehydrogenase [Actinomadura sp. LD22]|uniref:Zinc-binding dehydrogenase n=1 Tax=Actinomadura physcomitrii TaxID=2650748 RepID=A0A6I4M624_9ACTN|nr:zinc-binding dehydrogenase [Actinomadura physcomitrii]MWA01588.1 zinc-binding dehydrogenase [Actinomadura physcomitrii]
MKASVMESYGGPEVLRCQDVPDPRPRSGWSLVAVKAAALNWHDVLVRRGGYRSPLPHIPGADGAGVDRATGEAVMVLPSLWWGRDDSAPGPDWEILGDSRPGTYAELVAVPTECLVPVPSGLTWAQAAALPLVGVTVYRALFTRGRLRAGESLLVLGAGGGVATMAVSLAAAVGARVWVTSSSKAKIDKARELGAGGGVLYGDPGWPEAVRELAGGFDIVLDSVGLWAESLRVLRPGGRLVVLGASAAETAELRIRPYYFGQYDLLGTTMGSERDLAGLLALLERHRVPPVVVDRVFPLAEARTAHEHLEGGSGFGKTILEP